MAAQAGAGIKGHETKRLGLGRVDHFPDINAHGGVNHFQFIDQGDVDAAENVFRQFGASATRQEETGTNVLMARP
jgi:hypothetical protein